MNEELKIFITAQIDDLKKSMTEAQKQTKETATKGEKNFKKFGDAAKACGNAIKAGMKAVGTAVKAAATALAAGAASLVALSESTKEYRTEQAKLVSAFEAAGSSAEQAKETYNDLYRVLGDSGVATEAANHLAKLTTNQEDLAEWTNICQGVYATFGDSLPIEGLTEAANETAKVGTLTGSLADALNWAGVNEEAFQAQLDACNSEAEREALIRETLNGIYSEAAANYEENAAGLLSANEAQAKLTDGLAALGAAAEPITTIFKGFAGDILQNLVPGFEMMSEGLQDVINGVEGGQEKLSQGITNIVKSIADTITNLLPTLITTGVDIIIALINGIVSALPTLISAVVDAIPTIVQGIMDALPALIEGVVLLVQELSKALPDVMTVIVEALPDLLATILNALPALIPDVINGIVAAVVVLIENISAILTPIIEALPDILIAITDALMENLPTLIEGLITLIVALVENIPTIIQALIDAIPSMISSILTGILNAVPQIIAGLIEVVAAVVVALPEIFISLVEGVIDIFVGIFGSFTEVFAPAADWLDENVIQPIISFFTGAWDKLKSGASNAWEGIKSVFSTVANFFGDIFKKAWEKVKNVFSTGGKIFDGIKDGIVSAFKKVVNAIISGINKVIKVPFDAINGVINKIKGVSVAGLKPFSFLPTISIPSIPLLAKGGIVDSATLAMIGERGKEAVIPLENNLEWLDKMATMLSKKLGGNGQPIILEVDGKVFATTAINAINQNTRQTGRLALDIR